MNKPLHLIKANKTVLTFILMVGFTIYLAGQAESFFNTPGELSFTVKTVTDNGNYAPKHVLAIWVEDDQGFVKTRKLRANQRKQYLYTWKSASNNNVIDAVTGATLSSHQTHDIIWDCTDIEGNVVPDGDYTIYVEFTEKHAQGPLMAVSFTKGTEEQHLTPPDEGNFINMALDFIPETTAVSEVHDMEELVYPNPGNGLFKLRLQNEKFFTLNVYNSAGARIMHKEGLANSSLYLIDLTAYNSGIYFVEVQQGDKRNQLKIIKQ